MFLVYTGPDYESSPGAIPLPVGWTAADHEEPDEALAAEKCASGLYEALIAADGRTVRGKVTNITPDPVDVDPTEIPPADPDGTPDPVDVDPTEIPPADPDGTPGNGGFGTATGDPTGATAPAGDA
jgi:hypothetical protein